MNHSQMVFLSVGIVFLILAIALMVWTWWLLKNKCSDNELIMYGWFKKWIYQNRAAFVIMLTIITVLSGIALIAIALETPIV